jgi:hypothetical protein
MSCSVPNCGRSCSSILEESSCIGCAQRFCPIHLQYKYYIPTEGLFNNLCFDCYSPESANERRKMDPTAVQIPYYFICNQEETQFLKVNLHTRVYIIADGNLGAAAFTEQNARQFVASDPELISLNFKILKFQPPV